MSVTFGLILLGFVLGTITTSVVVLLPAFFGGYLVGKFKERRIWTEAQK
jgi:hypothetical protein